MKINITYIVSNINKAVAFEWISTYLNKQKFALNFILLNKENSELEFFLKSNNIKVDRIVFNSKKDIPLATYKVYRLLKKYKSKVVHAHLFEASIVGLAAAYLAKVPKRIYTRHHSDFHHVYFPKAVKYDKIINFFSTDIIAISKVVEEILVSQEEVSSTKIHLIHHGFKLEDYISNSELNINRLKQKYLTKSSYPIIGVISRYTEWKGVQYIISAFEKLLKEYPDALLILANARGDYKNEIRKYLQNIPSQKYIEITFESDITSLYKLFDVFVHVPITPSVEAFGQIYIECLAAEIPIIATNSGIAQEILVDKVNSLIVPYKNSQEIYNSILTLISDEKLKKQLKNNSIPSISEKFNLPLMIMKLETLYLK